MIQTLGRIVCIGLQLGSSSAIMILGVFLYLFPAERVRSEQERGKFINVQNVSKT